MENSKEQDQQQGIYEGAGPVVGVTLAACAGILAALTVLPAWAPSLAATLMGNSPKAYWYLARGLAFVSLALLWLSMVLGLLISDKIARSWPGSAAAFAVHEYVSLLGLLFAIFHALVLLGDRFIGYTWMDILVPFAAGQYRPIWVGLGQLCVYVWIPVALSFYVRRRIGANAWRLIHFASFFTFLVAIMHGLAAGTDTEARWAQAIYWFLGTTFLFLTVYRIAASISGPERRTPTSVAAARPPDA